MDASRSEDGITMNSLSRHAFIAGFLLWTTLMLLDVMGFGSGADGSFRQMVFDTSDEPAAARSLLLFLMCTAWWMSSSVRTLFVRCCSSPMTACAIPLLLIGRCALDGSSWARLIEVAEPALWILAAHRIATVFASHEEDGTRVLVRLGPAFILMAFMRLSETAAYPLVALCFLIGLPALLKEEAGRSSTSRFGDRLAYPPIVPKIAPILILMITGTQMMCTASASSSFDSAMGTACGVAMLAAQTTCFALLGSRWTCIRLCSWTSGTMLALLLITSVLGSPALFAFAGMECCIAVFLALLTWSIPVSSLDSRQIGGMPALIGIPLVCLIARAPLGALDAHAGPAQVLPAVTGCVVAALVASGWIGAKVWGSDGREISIDSGHGEETPLTGRERTDNMMGRLAWKLQEAYRLTAREAEVISQLAVGRSMAAIAAELGVSKASIQSYAQRAYGKMGVESKIAAIDAVRGLLDGDDESGSSPGQSEAAPKGTIGASTVRGAHIALAFTASSPLIVLVSGGLARLDVDSWDISFAALLLCLLMMSVAGFLLDAGKLLSLWTSYALFSLCVLGSIALMVPLRWEQADWLAPCAGIYAAMASLCASCLATLLAFKLRSHLEDRKRAPSSVGGIVIGMGLAGLYGALLPSFFPHLLIIASLIVFLLMTRTIALNHDSREAGAVPAISSRPSAASALALALGSFALATASATIGALSHAITLLIVLAVPQATAWTLRAPKEKSWILTEHGLAYEAMCVLGGFGCSALMTISISGHGAMALFAAGISFCLAGYLLHFKEIDRRAELFAQTTPLLEMAALRLGLSDAETRVVVPACAGQTTREIASSLFLSQTTVKTHLAHVYKRLVVHSRAELMRRLVLEMKAFSEMHDDA